MGSTQPLAFVVLGVAELERSLAFYRHVIGLDATEPIEWRGAAFERHWCLPAGASARAVTLSAGASPVGRIVLVEFEGETREPVRAAHEKVFLGLANLNFYTLEVATSARELVEAGCELWTDPVAYEVGRGKGQPTEVIVEGPDAVLFNLVQPEGEEGSPVGDIQRFLERRGTTRTGFSEVVTTAHSVRSIDEALCFYVDVLEHEIWLDEVFDRVDSNRLLGLPEDARSRITFVRSEHLFGKIAMIEALNYDVVDLVPRALAPNIGYLTMGFEVADLDTTITASECVGAELYSGPVELAIPGLGQRQSAMIRTPGSGALTQLISA